MSAHAVCGKPMRKALESVTVIFLEGGTPLATFTSPEKCQAYLLALERKFPEYRNTCRVERFPCDPVVRGP